MLRQRSSLVALMLECAYVTTSRVLFVGTREAALIGLQQITVTIGTAVWVAPINGRTSRMQRNGLGRTAVVPERAEFRVGIVHVTPTREIASRVAAQVVAFRCYGRPRIAVA